MKEKNYDLICSESFSDCFTKLHTPPIEKMTANNYKPDLAVSFCIDEGGDR